MMVNPSAEQEFTDEDTLLAEGNILYKADLRVFGAIGFQDAPNGLWLGKQEYRPRKSLLHRIVNDATVNEINVIGLTSEDDLIISGSPEDRFGFIKRSLDWISSPGLEPRTSYVNSEEGVIKIAISNGIIELYLVNCETRHANKNLGQDWGGLKVHVVGGNCLRKDLNLEDTIKDANDRGYMTFLMGPVHEASNEPHTYSSMLRCTGVIGHDANNAFREWITNLPAIGKTLSQYSRVKNELNTKYAKDIGKPSIAVSSAHWMHEIGRASITFKGGDGDEFKLADLRKAIEKGKFTANKGHNRMLDVLKFGSLLRKYGGKPDRFAGDSESSYNR